VGDFEQVVVWVVVKMISALGYLGYGRIWKDLADGVEKLLVWCSM
jgi:hypothetical protein